MSILLAAAAAMSYEAAEAEQARCVEAVTSLSDYDLGRCAQRRLARADERLNERWQELMALVGRESEMGKHLLAEERAWIAFKDAACNYFDVEGTGTADRFLFLPSCKLKIVEDRVAELDSIIEYARGFDGA